MNWLVTVVLLLAAFPAVFFIAFRAQKNAGNLPVLTEEPFETYDTVRKREDPALQIRAEKLAGTMRQTDLTPEHIFAMEPAAGITDFVRAYLLCWLCRGDAGGLRGNGRSVDGIILPGRNEPYHTNAAKLLLDALIAAGGKTLETDTLQEHVEQQPGSCRDLEGRIRRECLFEMGRKGYMGYGKTDGMTGEKKEEPGFTEKGTGLVQTLNLFRDRLDRGWIGRAMLEKNGWKEFLAAAAVLGKEKEAIAILQRSQAEAPLIPDPARAAYYLETVPSLAEAFTGILAPLFVETE